MQTSFYRVFQFFFPVFFCFKNIFTVLLLFLQPHLKRPRFRPTLSCKRCLRGKYLRRHLPLHLPLLQPGRSRCWPPSDCTGDCFLSHLRRYLKIKNWGLWIRIYIYLALSTQKRPELVFLSSDVHLPFSSFETSNLGISGFGTLAITLTLSVFWYSICQFL